MIQVIIDFFICKECMEIGEQKLRRSSLISNINCEIQSFCLFYKNGEKNFARSNLHISGFEKQQKWGDCYT
jgi:hypothetical protein